MKKQIAVLCPSMKEAKEQCDNLRRVMSNRYPHTPCKRLNPINLESDFCVVRFYSELSTNSSCYLQGVRFDLMIGFKAGVIMERANPNCEVILTYDEDAVVDQIIDYIERNEGEKSMSYMSFATLMLKKDHFVNKIKETFDKYEKVGLSYHIYHTNNTMPKDHVKFKVSFSFKNPDWNGPANGITFIKTIHEYTEYPEITEWVIAEMEIAVNHKYDLEKRLADLNNRFYTTSNWDRASIAMYRLSQALASENQNRQSIPGIEKVTFNDPATIVFWNDGTKTIVQARNGEKFDPEKGLAMAISKKALGNTHDYYETFLKEVGRYEKKQAKTKTKTKKTASTKAETATTKGSKKQGDK